MRLVTAATVLALTIGVAAAAQVAPARSGGAAPAVTLSGCLNKGPSGFVLTNVVAAGKEAEAGSKTGGPRDLARSYDVTAREGLALSAYVGQRVELVGAITEPKPGSAEAPAKDKADASPQFAVTSVKTISRICLQ